MIYKYVIYIYIYIYIYGMCAMYNACNKRDLGNTCDARGVCVCVCVCVM